MFTVSITYNCSFERWSNFTISYNQTLANCSILTKFSNITKNSTIDVTCDNIQNNAGRNWIFNINATSFISSAVINETFIITLPPLSLKTANITYDVDTNLSSALISVGNCMQIADLKDLVVRCNSSDNSTTPLLNNCTHRCENLQPGSIYNASLVLLSIPIVDNNDSFPNESRPISICLGKRKMIIRAYDLKNLSSSSSSYIWLLF